MLKKCLCIALFCGILASFLKAEDNKSCDCGNFSSQEQINKFFGLDKESENTQKRVKIPTH